MVLAPYGTLERTRTSGLPLRRRLRYPLRYQGLYKIFKFIVIFEVCSCYRLGGECSIQLSYRDIKSEIRKMHILTYIIPHKE